jgi:ribosome-binding protein aMBF1 (putative translation factor)
MYGVIYDHKQIAPTFDIACDLEDSSDVNGSSSKIGETLDKRPGHASLWTGDDRVHAVLDAVQKYPQSAPRVAVSPEGFLGHFNKSYAEGMNWRIKKGGASRDEIRRQIISKGDEVDEELVENVYKNLRRAHVAEAQRACLAQYLDEQKTPVAEWEHLQSRAVVVPEILETAELIDVLSNAQTLDEEQRQALGQFRKSSPSTLEAVDEILVTDVAAMGLEKVGEVHEPVHAYVLLTPVRENAAKALACA